MEVACGEAPYLVSRYDAAVCDSLIPVERRIGLFDRKLRIVGENTVTPEEWLVEAFNALHSTYGFEWQGDNLLRAREAMLYTFAEHYEAKFQQQLDTKTLENAAYIISWNLWQMDGLKYVVPDSCVWAVPEDSINDFDDDGNFRVLKKKRECPACKNKNNRKLKHIGIQCLVKDWFTEGEPEKPFSNLII